MKEHAENLRTTIQKYFPELWKETEIILAAQTAMFLKEFNDPLTIVLTGAASSGKTTILSFFYPLTKWKSERVWHCTRCEAVYREGRDNIKSKPPYCAECRNTTFNEELDSPWPFFKTDNFTPKSFVTHAANIKQEALEKIDLLPKIRDKILLTPELAPIFGKSKEEMIENFSVIARVLDGEGLETDSGSRGHRGYSGKFRFVWIGATTPLGKASWDAMATIGHRILFVKMDSIKKTDSDYEHIFLDDLPYSQKIDEIRLLVEPLEKEWLDLEKYRCEWDRKADRGYFKKIIDVALLVRLLRAKISMWMEKTEEGENFYTYSLSLPEEPHRLISALYNLARGRALLWGRTQLDEGDIEMIYRVALSSMPYERSDFFLKLIARGGIITTEQVEADLHCSKPTARKMMQALEIIGVCDGGYPDLARKHLEAIMLKSEYSWVVKDQLVLNLWAEIREKEANAKKECVESVQGEREVDQNLEIGAEK